MKVAEDRHLDETGNKCFDRRCLRQWTEPGSNRRPKDFQSIRRDRPFRSNIQCFTGFHELPPFLQSSFCRCKNIENNAVVRGKSGSNPVEKFTLPNALQPACFIGRKAMVSVKLYRPV